MEEENSNQEFEGHNYMFIYEWVDEVNLSRPKKNIARDFSDGGNDQNICLYFLQKIYLINNVVLVAELIKNFNSKLVELHNYPAAYSTNKKRYNWNTLNGN